MNTLLIVLVLLAIAVAIVWWATRKTPGQTATNAPGESDTAWNDPVTPAAAPRDDTISKL